MFNMLVFDTAELIDMIVIQFKKIGFEGGELNKLITLGNLDLACSVLNQANTFIWKRIDENY